MDPLHPTRRILSKFVKILFGAVAWAVDSLTSNLLKPGSSLTFSFDSTLTPTELASYSPFYSTTPIGPAFVYSGGPFSDAGDRIVATEEAVEYITGKKTNL
jgi:hypothetical protein